ncbi:hypothetical protein Q1M64_09475 (plasmid) [Sinorhizobium meliloti]|nr:hypothetical protein Q1M64_09475 [Sinorhizobium meliloti]
MTTIDPGKRRTAAASDLYSILIVAGFHSLLIFPWFLSDSTTTFRYMNAAPCPPWCGKSSAGRRFELAIIGKLRFATESGAC